MDNYEGSTVQHGISSIVCSNPYGKEWTCVYVKLIHFAVHLKLIQYCKLTILQQFF